MKLFFLFLFISIINANRIGWKVKRVIVRPQFINSLACKQIENSIVCVGRLRAFPIPEIMWFFNNKPLHDLSSRIVKRYNFKTGYFSLRIENVGLNDFGEYSIVATNTGGTDFSVFKLSRK